MADLDNEQQWIRDSLAGDESAYEELIMRYQKMIHTLTFRMTGSLEDADDLAQETFVRAFHQLGGFRGGSKFSTWLCQIAVNLSRNWRRQEARRDELRRLWSEDTFQAAPGAAIETALDEVSSCVQAALNRLPVEQRAVIVLTVYEELSHAEAAQVLGCPEATVSWRVFAARRKLKRWLKPDSSNP